MRKVIVFVFAFAEVLLGACDKINNTIHQWSGQPPNRKPGLWRLTLTRSYLPQPAVFLDCLDRQTDAQHPIFVRERPLGCERWSFTQQSNGSFVGDAICKGSRSGFTVSGDFGSRLIVDDWRVLDRGEQQWRAGTVLKRHSEWVYIGDCPTSIPPSQEQRPDRAVVPIGADVLR